jgi:hypothetical protein
MKFISLFIFLTACADEPSVSTQDSKEPVDLPGNDKGLPHKAPDVVVFHYPYNEDGTFIYSSNKEFHKKDCEGYRRHYGIQKETLPCESDDGIQFHFYRGFVGNDTSYVALYTGYSGVDSETAQYSTKISLNTWFHSYHSSMTSIEITGVTTRHVLDAASMSIFLWNYESRGWKNAPEMLMGYTSTTKHYDLKEESSYVNITSLLLEDEDSNKFNDILHNEEAFQIRMATWEADEVRHGSVILEKKHVYNIPTPTFREDMHRAWRHR